MTLCLVTSLVSPAPPGRSGPRAASLPAPVRRWSQRARREVLPRGNMLPQKAWVGRHLLITRFALLQSLCLGAIAVVVGRGPLDVLLAVLVPGLPALTGALPSLSRTARTLSTVASLMFASATLVDLYGGLTEAHFHFFVMIGVVSLYQDWAAFGLCVLITVLHHAVMGIGAPSSVFSDPEQQQHPIRWAIVHGGFILAASLTHMIAWKLNEQQELRDPLTRLANRASFTYELARITGSTGPVSVLFIDIDKFKAINDSGGHHVGDAALVHAAQAMQAVVPAGDLVSRLGGDEFAVLLRSGSEVATEVAHHIESALRAPLVVNGREVPVSASIGAVDAVLVGSRDGDVLMRAADLAMYAAKSSGRGQVATYSVAMEASAAHRARLAADLGQAVERGQLQVHYQPIIDAEVGRTCGVEALLRWDHPELGRIPPLDFIGLAEETGDIVAIGAWTLTEACCRVAQWQRETPGCERLAVAVNLSAQQLRDPHLLAYVGDALSRSGLAPTDLTLEVTETSMLGDLDLACRQLEAVRALGVSVAIDDFGTGYSSLAYLARLPADTVKIDRSFVADIADTPSALALVRCILDMAGALGLDVQAEGVEDEAQERLLLDLGCRWWQGYLFSPPVPAADLPDVVTAVRPSGEVRPAAASAS